MKHEIALKTFLIGLIIFGTSAKAAASTQLGCTTAVFNKATYIELLNSLQTLNSIAGAPVVDTLEARTQIDEAEHKVQRLCQPESLSSGCIQMLEDIETNSATSGQLRARLASPDVGAEYSSELSQENTSVRRQTRALTKQFLNECTSDPISLFEAMKF